MAKATKALKLGDKVKDKLTGFSGVLHGICDWQDAGIRYGILPTKLAKNGTTREVEWFVPSRVVKAGR